MAETVLIKKLFQAVKYYIEELDDKMAKQDIWDQICSGTFIIAEIGKNFIQTEDERPVGEYLSNAKKLALAAKEAGADAVKFQTHNLLDEQLNINVTSPHFKGSDRYSWVARNDKSTPLEGFWKPLKEYCNEIGIIFFSTPMSRGAAEKLDQLGVDLWKVGSGDMLDFVLLDYLASSGKPIIISTGMSEESEIDLTVNFLQKRNAKFAILHCVSKYPCSPKELNLSTIDYLRQKYQVPVGFSDHSVGEGGMKMSLMAAKLGAKIIEKHFSFERELWGSDHKASITPGEMKNLVGNIRSREYEKIGDDEIEEYLGSEGKILQEGETVFRPYFRKSLVAGCDIKAGETITKEMIYAMRPQAFIDGLPSEKYEDAIGKEARKNIKKYEGIKPEYLC
jgi:sialic acid synthase SpsE